MHDRTRPDRDGPENWRSRLFRADNRLVIAVAFVLMCLGILIGGHLVRVNSKQQPVAAGQAINVAADPATQCQLSVQSFDVFKATLVAACSGPKAK